MALTCSFCGTKDQLSGMLEDSLKRSRPPKHRKAGCNEGTGRDGVMRTGMGRLL